MYVLLLAIALVTAAPNANPAQVPISQNEADIVNGVNNYRAKKGLAPLTVDPILMKVARKRCPAYNHCQNGQWCWDACKAAGYKGWATDDIANGYESGQEAVDGWASSDGHAHQMRGDFKMNGQWCNYHMTHLGVARSGNKYIAIFGQ